MEYNMPFRPLIQRNPFHPANGFDEVIIGIYRIYNRKSGKSYIGQGAGKRGIYGRWYDHLKNLRQKSQRYKCLKLQAAWDKYEEVDWVWGVLEVCDKVPEVLNEREQYWMNFYNVVANGYNISPTASTTLGRSQTEEERLRRSVAMQKMYENPEERKKRGRKGWSHSEETKSRIRETNITTKANRPCAPAWNKGRPLSLEQRQHLSKMKLGHKVSEETKAKLRAHPRGKWMSRDGERKRVQEDDVPQFLTEGWAFGYKKNQDPQD